MGAMAPQLTRRACLAAATALPTAAAGEEWITSIERSVLWSDLDGKSVTWFQARIGRVPSAGRGLLEPSLAFLDGVFYCTIRAENGQGFVTRSQDGLTWEMMRPWCWDDGEPLMLSTTQQRWLPHSDAPWLVYTRRDTSNVSVMRWRAPLFLARVDPRKLCLLRGTERIALPLTGDGVRAAAEVEHLGNFHTTIVSREESLISAGSVIPAKGYTGAVRFARVRWARPNRLAQT
jgi:hypothetical protein